VPKAEALAAFLLARATSPSPSGGDPH
jgi:hypothetical protein